MREPAFDPGEEEFPAQSRLQWQHFAATGSIYDYLDYKSQLNGGLGKVSHANGNDGPGPAPSQGGGSGSDPDAAFP